MRSLNNTNDSEMMPSTLTGVMLLQLSTMLKAMSNDITSSQDG